VSGKGRSAIWREIPWSDKKIEPQYVVAQRDAIAQRQRFGSGHETLRPLIAFMDVTSATNRRTMHATIGCAAPHGNRVPMLIS